MIAIRTSREIDLLRKADAIVAEVLGTLADQIEPGVTTADLDAIAEDMIRSAGAEPSFLGYQGFPASTCISIDEVIVHGIPGKRRLKEGQICSIDVGVKYKGYYGDAALSIACGQLDDERVAKPWIPRRQPADEGVHGSLRGQLAQERHGHGGPWSQGTCPGVGVQSLMAVSDQGLHGEEVPATDENIRQLGVVPAAQRPKFRKGIRKISRDGILNGISPFIAAEGFGHF